MKNFITLLIIGLSSLGFTQANYCNITVSPLTSNICPGDSVLITVEASLLPGGQSFNFNGATLPSGWSTSGTSYFSSPCGTSPDGTPYFWAGTAGTSGYPNITTDAFDVSCPGGFITFDMVYAVQGGPTPCEGPDLENEGVAIEYSIDGGLTWITILYYRPDGTILTYVPTTSGASASGPTPFTTWNNYTVNIPPAAQTASTKFRWYQYSSSTSCCDNWGLDNIIINAYGQPCSDTYNLVWSNGLSADSAYITTSVDTSFTIDVYDISGNLQCTSSQININVYDDNLTYQAPEFAYSYCPTTNPNVAVTNIVGSIPPYTVTWTDIPSTNNPQSLSTGGAEHDTIVYHFTVQDGCQFERQDSVTLIVNKLLNIDSMVTYPASACANDGTVVAFVSGITVTTTQPFYKWHGPGASNPSFINSTVWQNRASGWYYFEVHDEVCTDYDSVFLDQAPPPMAAIAADPLSGCAPFDVTFTNNSQNANQYYWDFGDGQNLNTANTNPVTHPYSGPATIMLIASNNGNCPDTAFVAVTTVICGCTDPASITYDPNAVIDDGSCVYPEPIIKVPNIFTPNGDNENEFFELMVTNYSKIEFIISNRWGNVVFEGSGLNPKWDGKMQGGAAAPTGVYFVKYIITNLMGDKTYEGQTFVELYR